MYIKLNNEQIEKYPYTIDLLRKDNPQTSFPENPTKELLSEWNVYAIDEARWAIAAAFRAAVDQVAPQTPSPSYPDDYESGAWEANQWARMALLAIAAELNGTNNTSQEDYRNG
jgi:hypothetical protein